MSGSVLGLKLQPYEAHIPYLLQFKLDWNLYGMAHLVLRAVSFRRDPPPASQPLRTPPATWRHALTPILPAAPNSAGGSGGTGSQVCMHERHGSVPEQPFAAHACWRS